MPLLFSKLATLIVGRVCSWLKYGRYFASRVVISSADGARNEM
jgi:hypothetical protein